jgi:hypothetical protein
MSPKEGWPLYYLEIIGSGFQSGVRVTFGGVETFVSGNPSNTGKIVTNPPWRDPATVPGTVDVVVTNPDGTSVTIAGGFTYKVATLELSSSEVNPGETVVVTWSGPNDPSDFAPPDTIGLYELNSPFTTELWGTTSGIGDRFSAQFKAPMTPGSYEVRYRMLSKYLLAKASLVVR